MLRRQPSRLTLVGKRHKSIKVRHLVVSVVTTRSNICTAAGPLVVPRTRGQRLNITIRVTSADMFIL